MAAQGPQVRLGLDWVENTAVSGGPSVVQESTDLTGRSALIGQSVVLCFFL